MAFAQNIEYSNDGTCKCQILRSASAWSIGLKEKEKSI